MVSTARLGDSAGRRASGLLIVALIACAGARTAQANVEIGAMGGAHVFSDTSELGATDGPNAPSQRNSGMFGVRVGGFVAGLLGLEAEFGVIPTEAREAKFAVTDVTYRAHLVLELGGGAHATVIPFVLAGAGGFTVVTAKNRTFKADPEKNIEPDTDAAFYGGVGVKVRLGDKVGLRLDGRVLLVPSSENTIPADPSSRKQTVDYEVLASAYFELGGEPTHAVTRPPEPPRRTLPPHRDPEPTADADADGIPDASDRCPAEAEDKDGYQDDDGCPDPDNDVDGVPDGQDKCPLAPEDKDGFQDADGCPDPDNDGDGVLDPSDACLDQLETKNGYQDTDGCPDELPAAVKILEGVLPKVGFKVFATDVTPGTTRQLDAVVRALIANPELHLAIHVHTDDEVVTRGLYPDNLELSQARAEAVMSYLVSKGVAAERLVAKGFGDTRPAVSPAGLEGKKLAAVRVMNRRVELHLISPLP